MRRKDVSVEVAFHPVITQVAFSVDAVYRAWNDELVITSGSEHSAKHMNASLHYATPGCALDVRTWDADNHGRGVVPRPADQLVAVKQACADLSDELNIPSSWIDVVLENDHIHIEYQPKK